ncbi:MAG: hypothetical protein AB1782_08315 [Cyanobacteriota bacterium]
MLSQINLNSYNTIPTYKKGLTRKPEAIVTKNSQLNSDVKFTGLGSFITSPVMSMSVLPKLQDQALKQAYIEVNKFADAQGKADLKFLLDNGKLLSNDADDGSSTLLNLARIVREPRANGLDSKIILNSTLRALANPYSITQNFGKLSPEVSNMIMNDPNYSKVAGAVGLDTNQNANVAFTAQKKSQQVQQNQSNLPAAYNVEASGTCVAASMEFNLADKRPAEFARYAADLTSPKMAVEEVFNFSDIDPDPLSAMYWLDQFNVEYDADNFTTGKVILRPDQAAIYRAISQSKSRSEGSRSPLDVLMQSTFMQLGSAKSYNSLTDIRTGGFNQSDRGLTEFEKSMAEAIVDDKGGKSSVTYQVVDDNAFLVGYNKNYQDTLMDIINSLKSGFNVIVGITETDANAQITGGHEITIVGSKLGQDGKLYFICNDTDDDIARPIELSANELIPKIHHAGIPNVVINKNPQPVQEKPIIIQNPPQLNAALATVPVQQSNFQPALNNSLNQSRLNLVA